MPVFNGVLGSNAIYSALYNMIISQTVFDNPIKKTYSSLVDMARVDGGLYGDRKLYYSTDVLRTYEWGADAEATNLLETNRAPAPKCQTIILDQFRQIRLTTDEYLSKQAWMGEGSFSQFQSVLIGWISNTKRVYDTTYYNTRIGTIETSIGQQKQTVALPAIANGADNAETEAFSRACASAITKKMADIVDLLSDPSRDFNDYEFLRSYAEDDFIVVWNSEQANKLHFNDLPTIYHRDLATPIKFNQYKLPQKYFGTKIEAGGNVGAAETVRTLVEGVFTGTNGVPKHCFPGDVLPAGSTYLANEAYREDPTILFKIVGKGALPFMSAFEVGTSFYNPRSLSTNHYLTFGFSSANEHLFEKPWITVRAVASEQ